MDRSARIFIVDDHPMVIAGLRLYLRELPRTEIAGVASDCATALAEISRLRPDVVLMDLDVPTEGGVALTGRVAQVSPESKVIVLTGYCAPGLIGSALEAGARGYVFKLEAGDELREGIEAVLAGRVYVSPKVSALLAAQVRKQGGAGGSTALSDREREVVRRIAEGESTKEIAAAMDLSPKTVDTHRQNVMQKTGARGIADLTKFAIREGIAKA